MFNKQRIINLLFTTAILLLVLSSLSLAADNLVTHFIDVGQGDAILVELPNGQNMLIDGGSNQGESLIVNYLHQQEIETIDYLIGTHPHADHIGGLDSVINNFKLGDIYLPNVTHTTQTYKDVLLAVKRKNKKIISGKADIKLLTTDNLQIELVGPVKHSYKDLNNHSLVTKVTYKQTSFLFTGDLEAEAEQEIIYHDYNLQADLLKVAHHGSSSSTSHYWLGKVNPKYAVISVGQDNRYGHPSKEVINRLNNSGIQTYRTDQQGTITAVSNGQKINFNQAALDKQRLKKKSINSVKISALNRKTEIVEITNTSDQLIDISGWKLVSVKGQQTFYFPSETILSAGEKITVTAGPDADSGPNKIIWDDWYIWNNNGDSAKLYNTTGKLISNYP